MVVGERLRRVIPLAIALVVLISVPALAGETHVYGDPGSGDFSIALAVTADEDGNAYVMGAFYGEFQGVTSNGWDLWMARIADDGSFAWLRTWDETTQGYSGDAGPAPWTDSATYELLVDSSGRVRGRIGSISAALISVNADGTDPDYTYLSTGKMGMPALVSDGSGDVIGFMPVDGQSGVGRVRPDGTEVWLTPIALDQGSPIVVASDGSVVTGRTLPRLAFQTPAVAVSALDSDGDPIWETTIYDACFLGGGNLNQGVGNPLIDMGTEVGLLTSSGNCGPDDPEWVSTLSLETGERLSHRVMKDQLNIIWCEDPRLGPATEAISYGFVDGDECGGGDVFWTDVNHNLVSQGTPLEGYSIVRIGVVNQGESGYGVLRSAPEGDRWKPDRLDYVGPAPDLVPFDMAMTKNGAMVVGRTLNTAWIGTTAAYSAMAPSDTGAAVTVTLDMHAGRTFLPDGHTVGLVDPTQGLWHLYDNVAETRFYYGNPGDYPFMGDWNCNGTETPGLYRQSDGFVYLRNTNTQGNADIRFYFGNPGDVPVAGDFNGDGCDTVSIYRPSNQTFYIINKLGANDGGLGAAETSYVFGNPGDKPFVGDFNGDGSETVGLHRESTGLVYFRNSHTQGNADNQFIFGNPGDRFVAGDWTGAGYFTPALFRPSNATTYFRFTNTQGNADHQFTQGRSEWLPVAGASGP